MRIIKIILSILLTIGGLGSLISFFQQVNTYEGPELIGHLIALALISWGIYALLKTKNN